MNLLKFQFALLFVFLISSSLVAQNWSPYEGSPQEYLRKGEIEEALRIMKANPKWISLVDGNGYTPFHYSVGLEKKDVALWLLENGATIDEATGSGETALFLAKTVEMADLLLKHGANVNAINERGETPIFHPQSLEVAKLLLANEPDLEHKDNDDQTALLSISRSIENSQYRVEENDKRDHRKDRSELAFALIAAGADYDLESAICLGDLSQVKRKYRKGVKDEYSDALRIAVHTGQVEICNYLFAEENVDLKKPLNGYDSLFYLALDHPGVLKLFIEKGASVEAKIHCGAMGFSGYLPIIGGEALVIHHAVYSGAPPESIKLILDAGADPFDECESMASQMDEDAELVTPMDVAFFNDNAKSILALVAHPKFRMDPKGKRQELFDSYLFRCFGWKESPRIVELLLEKGANPRALLEGYSALQANWQYYELISSEAAERNQGLFDVAKLLIQKGLKQDLMTSVMFADHDSVEELLAQGQRLKDENHFNAIGICIKERRPKILRSLLESGVKIEEGPLSWAAAMGQKEVVAALLHHGADVNERDRLFRSPLHCAVRAGYPDIVKMLLHNGADPAGKDGRGKTPVQACDDSVRRIEMRKIIEQFLVDSQN